MFSHLNAVKINNSKIHVNKLGTSSSIANERDWKQNCSLPRWRTAVTQVDQNGRNNSQWNLFFIDLDELLSEYEQHQSTNDIAITETLNIRLENAVQALQNVCHFVSEINREAVLEMTRIFQLMFWDCHRRSEFPSRTRCSQVAIFSLSSPNRVHTGQVGRPKFDIKRHWSSSFPWVLAGRIWLVCYSSRAGLFTAEFQSLALINHLSRF